MSSGEFLGCKTLCLDEIIEAEGFLLLRIEDRPLTVFLLKYLFLLIVAGHFTGAARLRER